MQNLFDLYGENDGYVARIKEEREDHLKVLEILLSVPDLDVNIEHLKAISDVGAEWEEKNQLTGYQKAVQFCQLYVSEKMKSEENVTQVVFALQNNLHPNIVRILVSAPSAVEECRR